MAAKGPYSFQELDCVSIQKDFKSAHPTEEMSRLFSMVPIDRPEFQHMGIACLQSKFKS
jgi:hypothetical protein